MMSSGATRRRELDYAMSAVRLIHRDESPLNNGYTFHQLLSQLTMSRGCKVGSSGRSSDYTHGQDAI